MVFIYIIYNLGFIKDNINNLEQKNISLQSNVDTFKLNLDSLQADLKNIKEILDNIKSKYVNRPDLPSIIAKWRPFVVYIECNFGSNYLSGSGFLTDSKSDNGIYVVTNKHILIDNSGQSLTKCNFQLPGNNTIYSFELAFNFSENIDLGILKVNSPDNYIKNLISSKTNNYMVCRKIATSVGDDIVILGYPVGGSQNDITPTEGIISGYDGNYYITSAKMEHGNSGGVAILVNQNCYVGMPTFVRVGDIESYGRILNVDAIGIFN